MSIANMTLHDRLVAADRCATLGRSAAQLAHEMGNQLCMLPLLELIEEQYARPGGPGANGRRLPAIPHERLVQIINEVKAFVRFDREQRCDAGHRPERYHSRAGRICPLRAKPAHWTSSSVDVTAQPWAKVHRVKLQQVLINLLKNAAHAIRERADGQIELTLAQERRLRRDRGQGQRLRHDPRSGRPHLGTVFHHQGRRRHRAGAGRRQIDRRGPRRNDRPATRRRAEARLHDSSAQLARPMPPRPASRPVGIPQPWNHRRSTYHRNANAPFCRTPTAGRRAGPAIWRFRR